VSAWFWTANHELSAVRYEIDSARSVREISVRQEIPNVLSTEPGRFPNKRIACCPCEPGWDNEHR
jgi:hypothetical protein